MKIFKVIFNKYFLSINIIRMKFFVFYSSNCGFCQKLINIIQEVKVTDQCQLVCFESNPDKFPQFITNVPTIIAENLTKPLVGKEAMDWIENKKFFNQITNNINKKNVIDPKIKSPVDDLGFNKSESTSISDHYTNINDVDIEKAMLDYNKVSDNAPITNDLSNKRISDTKINNELQEQKLKELILLRKHQLMSRTSGISKIK
jgi:hypothetical protein